MCHGQEGSLKRCVATNELYPTAGAYVTLNMQCCWAAVPAVVGQLAFHAATAARMTLLLPAAAQCCLEFFPLAT
jgi:hypothetical protein